MPGTLPPETGKEPWHPGGHGRSPLFTLRSSGRFRKEGAHRKLIRKKGLRYEVYLSQFLQEASRDLLKAKGAPESTVRHAGKGATDGMPGRIIILQGRIF